jgi:hypothetical protein
VTKPVSVRSVNGPLVTSIVGSGPNGPGGVRCVYLMSAALLSGFTLTNGATQSSGDSTRNQSGGGVWCESAGAVVTNCVLTGNSASYYGGGASCGTLNRCALASNSARDGGGAYYGTLNNCALTGNSASSGGGGAYYGTLNNCTLTGNSANSGSGGAYYGTLNNCIVYYNQASAGSNYSGSSLNYCCTAPLPTSGIGNITDAPLLVDQAGGNLRLQPASPCINAGNSLYVSGSIDLDGSSRVVGGTVDIGAYECQSPPLLEYYSWLQGYGLTTYSSAYYVDSDLDGRNNWQEWICGTDPTNSLSVLSMLTVSNSVAGVTVSWQGVSNRTYCLERSWDLLGQPTFTPIQSNIAGHAGTTSFTDTSTAGARWFFYRVGVQQ